MHVGTVAADEEQYKKEEIDNFKRVLEIINLDLMENICSAVCAAGGCTGCPVYYRVVGRAAGMAAGTIGGILTHSGLPCGMTEETITVMGKSRVSCSTDISDVSMV